MSYSINDLVYSLNEEYREFLIKAKEKIISENLSFKCIIDAFISFWNINKKKADHLIKYFSNESASTVVFTGVGYMDSKNGEAIPFLLSGKRYIYDETVCSRISILSIPKVNIRNMINELIKEIDDEVDIIERYGKYISIIPLRYYYGMIKNKDFNNQVNNLFLDLFDQKYTDIKCFFDDNRNLVDVENNINKNKFELLRLTSFEENNLSIEEKVNRYFDNTNFLDFEMNFAQKIYFSSISVIGQALDILLASFACGFSPYIRNEACFNNFIVLSDSFITINKAWISLENERLLNNMVVNLFFSFALYYEMDITFYKDKLQNSLYEPFLGKYYDFYREYVLSNKIIMKNVSLIDAQNIAKVFIEKLKI